MELEKYLKEMLFSLSYQANWNVTSRVWLGMVDEEKRFSLICWANSGSISFLEEMFGLQRKPLKLCMQLKSPGAVKIHWNIGYV